jgi:hypothetical protein
MTKLARSSSLLIQPEVFEETLESGQKKHTSGRHPNLRNAKCKQLVRSNLIVLVVGSSLIMGTITLLATTLLKQSIIEGLSSQLPIESTTTTEVNITNVLPPRYNLWSQIILRGLYNHEVTHQPITSLDKL